MKQIIITWLKTNFAKFPNIGKPPNATGKPSQHKKERFGELRNLQFNNYKLSNLSEMKEIIKSNLNHARNAEHFQFHADVLSVLTAEVAQAQNIGAESATV